MIGWLLETGHTSKGCCDLAGCLPHSGPLMESLVARNLKTIIIIVYNNNDNNNKCVCV